MFGLEKNRYTWGAYFVVMVATALLAFGDQHTHHFLDGWDDWDMMADMRVIAKNRLMLFSQERLYEVRPPVDLVFLSGYLL